MKITLKLPLQLFVVSLMTFTQTLFGAAVIEIDSSYFDFGKIKEGKVEKLSHTFLVKNTGTDTLKIEKVKPG